MILFEKHATILFTIFVSVIGGLFVYYTLEYVLIPKIIAIPLAIVISLLIFGLTRFYSQPFNREDYNVPYSTDTANQKFETQTIDGKINPPSQEISTPPSSPSIFLFIAIYSLSLASSIFSNPDFGIFKSWDQISPFSILQLGASIMLAFFLPGYALLLVMSGASRLQPLPKVILAYLFSMLITGLTTFIIGATFDAPAYQIKVLLLTVHFVILSVLLVSHFHKNGRFKLIHISKYIFLKRKYPKISANKGTIQAIKTQKYEILVFASLFALLIVSTYYTYGGITLGDQWFHQGRSILFLSGSWKQITLSGLESYYPPFQSALIAGLTSLSGVPIVNTYASFAFLNIMPIFCFYYFFSNWIPRSMQGSKILASSIFAIFSGFGWIYLISLAGTTGAITTEISSIDTIYSIRSYILMPSNFVMASHPDFNTGLIYIALPAGLVLLGLARQAQQSKITYTVLVTMVSTLGLLSHDEFHFFIIITCLIPLLFRLKQRHYLYFALFLSLCIIYAINLLLPQNYYNSTEVLGFPLLSLNIFFVAVTWFLYFLIPYMGRTLARHLGLFISLTKPIKNRIKRDAQIKGIVRIVIVTLIPIIYLSSFIILAPLSLKAIDDEALRGVVPWYQYPMKLGLAGLLGLAFIISYIFRKYEKEVFIFAIIIVVALLTGPYYDQHRFSKYFMLGMIGFASLLVYKIIEIRPRPRPIINGIILMVVITTGSLSTLLFIGYNSLAFQNHDYVHDLGRRNFPSDSELQLIKAIKNGINFDSNRYNVISIPNEYNFYKGTLLTKLASFAGVPSDKLLQGRFVLNVSNLDSLYRLLDYTNTRFIIIPKDSIRQQETELSESARFALDAFSHYYEDEKYVVLDVPALASPRSSGSSYVALVYNNIDDSVLQSHNNQTSLLKYNSDTFNSIQLNNEDNQSKKQGGALYNNQIQNTFVCSPKKDEGITAWSKALDDIGESGINYVHAAFRIAGTGDNGKWSDAGLRWTEGNNKQYYASISKNGLELYQKSVDSHGKGEIDKKLLYQNTEVQKKENIWYDFKIVSLSDSINIYVGDTLKIKFARTALDNDSLDISSVGLSCFNEAVEFAPIRTGAIDSFQHLVNDTKNNYEHYFPLNVLALSNTQYETFMDNDLSALSKKIVVLAFDPLSWDDARFNHYLQYVNNGGTLVVINSDSAFNGRFADLFSIQINGNASSVKFANIAGINNQVTNISGMVNTIDINPSGNASIIASYLNYTPNGNNHAAVPFALEKHYSNGGKIILVNSAGYFDEISKSTSKYFMTLSNIFGILGIKLPQAPPESLTTMPIEQFVGTMDISGNVTLKSNSVLLLSNSSGNDENGFGIPKSRNINTKRITIYEDKKLNSEFTSMSIKELNLVGDYNVTINSKDLKLPYMTSQYDYFGIFMPKFNMTINLSDKPLSSAQIVIQNQKNQTSLETIKVNGGSTIQFDNIQSNIDFNGSGSISRSAATPILLKNPEIQADGNRKFTTLRFSWHYLENVKVDMQGLKTQLGFIDHYNEPYGNGTKIKYITFMNSTNDH